VPVGVMTAVFLAEVAPKKLANVVRPAVELLAGIPSVIYGLLGILILNPLMYKMELAVFKGSSTHQYTGGANLISAVLVLALMILPTITSLSIDALTSVPRAYREGSYGVGASRWQTVWHVVLRAAMPSLCTAVVLGMTRAFGEALAVQMVVGNAAQMPDGLFTPAATLTSVLTMGIGNEMTGTVYANVLWSLALLLLIMSLVFIAIIHFIEHKGGLKKNG